MVCTLDNRTIYVGSTFCTLNKRTCEDSFEAKTRKKLYGEMQHVGLGKFNLEPLEAVDTQHDEVLRHVEDEWILRLNMLTERFNSQRAQRDWKMERWKLSSAQTA